MFHIDNDNFECLIHTHKRKEREEEIEQMDIKEGEIDIHYDKSSQNVFSMRHWSQ